MQDDKYPAAFARFEAYDPASDVVALPSALPHECIMVALGNRIHAGGSVQSAIVPLLGLSFDTDSHGRLKWRPSESLVSHCALRSPKIDNAAADLAAALLLR